MLMGNKDAIGLAIIDRVSFRGGGVGGHSPPLARVSPPLGN